MCEAQFLRRLEPAEFSQVFDARRLERENDLGQIQPLDLRQLLRRTMRVFVARPEPHAHARRGAASASGTLVGTRLRNIFDHQRVDPAIGVEARDAREAAINHQPHAVDGQRRFRHIRRHDDLALRITRHGGVLVVRRQFAVQWQQNKTLGFVRVADGLDGLRNFKPAGHEHEHIALPARAHVLAERIRRLFPNWPLVVIAWIGGVTNLNRKHAAFRSEHARLEIEQRANPCRASRT